MLLFSPWNIKENLAFESMRRILYNTKAAIHKSEKYPKELNV